ncbi:MAG: transposase [Acidimicrobiales bacterium]
MRGAHLCATRLPRSKAIKYTSDPRKGHDYVSLFMDPDERRVMFATPGKDTDTARAFAEDLAAHGRALTTPIHQVCCDMSPAFNKGVTEYRSEPGEAESSVESDAIGSLTPSTGALVDVAPQRAGGAPVDLMPASTPHRPEIIFDRYYVVAQANVAVDEVRRAESKTRPELK